MMSLYIIGAGGHAKVVFQTLKQAGLAVEAFIVDAAQHNGSLYSTPVIQQSNFSSNQPAFFHVAIGNNSVRKSKQCELVSCQRLQPKTAIHPAATLYSQEGIGEGSLVAAGAIVGPDATIGDGCIVNHNAVVDHDCIVADFCHIAPAATLAGNVKVGECSLIGAGANILPGVNIGRYVTVGAGSVVNRDIPDGCTVVGSPAKIIKQVNLSC